MVLLLRYATDKQIYKVVNNEEKVNGKLVLNHEEVFRPSYPQAVKNAGGSGAREIMLQNIHEPKLFFLKLCQ